MAQQDIDRKPDMELVVGANAQTLENPVLETVAIPARVAPEMPTDPFRLAFPSHQEMREIFQQEGADDLPRFWQVAGLTQTAELKLNKLVSWIRNGSKHSQVKVAEFKGPSGTGKTFAVEALAGETSDVAQYWELDAGQILSAYHSEGAQNMIASFGRLLRERVEALANGTQPNLIVAIHEGETIGGDRDSGDREYANVVNALINGVDVMKRNLPKGTDGRILFVFTTNKDLDDAVESRAGAEVIDFKLPGDEGRAVALVSALNMQMKQQEREGHDPYFEPELEERVKAFRNASPEERIAAFAALAREWRPFIHKSKGASQRDIATAVQSALEMAELDGKLVDITNIMDVLQTMMPQIQSRNASEGTLRRVN